MVTAARNPDQAGEESQGPLLTRLQSPSLAAGGVECSSLPAPPSSEGVALPSPGTLRGGLEAGG